MTAVHAGSWNDPARATGAVAAVVPGAVAAAALWLALVGLGLLPQGTAGWAALGIGLALLAGLGGAAVHARLVAAPAAVRGGAVVAGAQVTRALALGFVLKLVALLLGGGLLWVAGVKFPQVAAFAVAFAGAAMLCQGGAALVFARRMQARSAADHPVSESR